MIGAVLTALSFLVLNLTSWIGILVIGMILMSIGEIIAFPFSNAFAMERAKRGNQGEYMALYSIAFGIAQTFGHNSSMQLVDKFGFEFTWYASTILMLICSFILVILNKHMKLNQD